MLSVDESSTVSGSSDAGASVLNTDGLLWLGQSLDIAHLYQLHHHRENISCYRQRNRYNYVSLGQLYIPPWVGAVSTIHPKGGDALWLGCKGRYS